MDHRAAVPHLIRALLEWTARHPEPARLLVPSLRVGRQWLDQLARCLGRPVVGLEVTTLARMARELAQPALAGRRELTPSLRRRVVERLWIEVRRRVSDRYLTALPPTANLLTALARTIGDLRWAGLAATDLVPTAFESRDKGFELATLLAYYEDDLRSGNWFDEAAMWQAAAAAVHETHSETLPLLVPRDLPAAGLALRFLDALKVHAGERLHELPVDEPGALSEPRTDLERVAWLAAPAAAPPPVQDGTLRVVRALNEATEVQNVLRTCLTEGWPLDSVEVIHTDGTTYIPLWHEISLALRTDRSGRLPQGVPITFAEGVPCHLTRPGRALAAWLAWIRSDYAQTRFIQLLEEDLVVLPPTLGDLGTAKWAAALRPLAIGMDRRRYEPALAGAQSRATAVRPTAADWSAFWSWLEPCLALLPGDRPTPEDVLAAAERFVAGYAAGNSRLDHFARKRLIDLIQTERAGLVSNATDTSFDPWRWLDDLPRQTHVGAAGAAPGCLHVAGLAEGGHSGRPHTFLLGLDDGRIPAAAGPDPLLLDRERLALSPELATSGSRQDDERMFLLRMLARLRGTLVVSYPTMNLAEDRERFPSSLAVNLARLATGRTQTDLASLEHALGPVVGPHPAANQTALSMNDAWRRVLSGPAPVPPEMVQRHFPDVAPILTATAARQAPAFSAYDGYVPAAGPILDPAGNPDVVVSPNMLETLGRCPRAYFFRYGLQVTPLPDHRFLADRWLPADAKGRLLHDLLYHFLRNHSPADGPPRHPRDLPRLLQLLERQLDRFRSEFPVRDEHHFRVEVEELRRLAQAFLIEEGERPTDHRPTYLEAVVGMAGGDGPLDTQEPVRVPLEDGLSLRLRGRIDRIDRRGDSLEFIVWDYKTGNPARFEDHGLFHQGRRLQHLLYLLMAETRLRELHGDGARVTRFGYYFLHIGGLAEQRAWSHEAVRAGLPLLALLRAVVAAGTFPATTQPRDCDYCDFRTACSLPADNFTIATKLLHAGNDMLQPYRELRHAETESR
jgi:hypothetical protein